jgi:alkylated DNA repair protein (DNA oxidative demethylase)
VHEELPEGLVYVGDLVSEDEERMRFQQTLRGRRSVAAIELAPRSAYVLSGAARWSWQHSIPPAKELRYSVTFRTLRRTRGS